MKRLGGLAAALLLALLAAGCTASSSPAPQGGGPTPCGGSTDWPPLGYTATLPAGVEIKSSGPMAARVANSGDAAIHVRVSDWGLGTCTGWVSFSPDRSADVPAHSATDFALEDPSSSGIPFRVAVEVWSPACSGNCSETPTGFWSGPLTQP
jgi:hypothetical protein